MGKEDEQNGFFQLFKKVLLLVPFDFIFSNAWTYTSSKLTLKASFVVEYLPKVVFRCVFY